MIREVDLVSYLPEFLQRRERAFILPHRSGAITDIILKLEKIFTAITTVSS